MEVQTTVIHVVLGINLLMNVILLFPWFDNVKRWFIQFYAYNMVFKTIRHIFNIFYVMIGVLLVDSAYKMNITESKLLEYQSQRNMYLCAFAIFLYFNLRRLVTILDKNFSSAKDNTYIIKQHKNAEDFLKSVVDKYNAEQEKNKQLEDKIKKLCKKVETQIEEISQIDQNKKAYLRLKDKYEELLAKFVKETKKNK
ncbi:hypothetical protein EHP00_1908 [Ecytonucleospora hepatopenaei]|uniref:Endoplasmic reticulum transmembrane protein n=1 Tax=Ecytonucleospora hepatopenaei TaxID=646526 RepID=A0A1W0E2B9_9MICR|nr:hypothetical protein EHP00_1908 [Ecytonucleospora hepatopenaei]